MHATISYHDAVCCAVAFAFDAATKDTIKALPGADFDGHTWILPILHLPILKLIFSTLTVAPDVVSAYHGLLRKMLGDFLACGQPLPKHLAAKHANGITMVLRHGPVAPTMVNRPVATMATANHGVDHGEHEDHGLALWLRSVQGAVKAEERKKAMLANKRRKSRKMEA